LLTGGPWDGRRPAAVPEAVRRQGSHVAPVARRDYVQDLRRPASTRRTREEARIRANQDLLAPFLRARQEVAASMTQRRNHLLIGEPGVGKQSLVRAQFRHACPDGRITQVNCASFPADRGAWPHPMGELAEAADDRPQLLLLCGLNRLTPVAAHRLDEALRPLVALEAGLVVAGCIDTPAVDATRPYGLLLRHFHQITRVPALRFRLDEIGDISLSILSQLTGRRSLRLGLQVIRVLEGYAWPGNINELQDVLKYVLVSQNAAVGHRRDVALQDVQVGTADGRRVDSDHDVGGFGDRGIGDVFPGLLARSAEHQCFHGPDANSAAPGLAVAESDHSGAPQPAVTPHCPRSGTPGAAGRGVTATA
jgi:sigma-54 dependent transcriptional regulator, acetoin dehydrogenase operon transcriptional activator AcoR